MSNLGAERIQWQIGKEAPVIKRRKVIKKKMSNKIIFNLCLPKSERWFFRGHRLIFPLVNVFCYSIMWIENTSKDWTIRRFKLTATYKRAARKDCALSDRILGVWLKNCVWMWRFPSKGTHKWISEQRNKKLTFPKSSGSYSILANESKIFVKSIMVRRFSSSVAVPAAADEEP